MDEGDRIPMHVTAIQVLKRNLFDLDGTIAG